MTDPTRAKNLHRYGDGDAAKSALDSVIPAITITVKFSKCRKVGVGGAISATKYFRNASKGRALLLRKITFRIFWPLLLENLHQRQFNLVTRFKSKGILGKSIVIL